MSLRGAVAGAERHQAALYLAAIAIGAGVGLAAPAIAPALEHAVTPVLMVVLFATFLGIPLIELGSAFRDVRFLATVLVANFVVVPLIAWALSRFVADDRGLLLGVLLVLLTPCVDYVVAFTGMAGGAKAKLLAATPLLMLAQVLLLPGYLALMVGPDIVRDLDPAPVIEAFVLLIVIPLAAATLVQLGARRWPVGRAVGSIMSSAMVPLMMATLLAVVGSQIAAVGAQAESLVRLIPVYGVYLVLAIAAGYAAARTARLDPPATRAVMLSAGTRNSLVVLPVALALPAPLNIAALAIITQTLVELVGLVALVRLVPRWVPGGPTVIGKPSGRHDA